MFKNIKRIFKIIRIKIKNKNVYFMEKANIGKHTIFEGQNKIGRGSWLDGYIGYGSYIGNNCNISAKIGRFSSIADNVVVLTGTHPINEFVSTCPAFYSLGLQNGTTFINKNKFKEKLYYDEINKYGCIIGNDVWIGYGVTIIGGCKIGDGAIIGTGSIVTKDVEPYSIVVGSPAKIIKKRFTEDQIKMLLNFKWWDKPIEWIKENANEFEDVNAFISNLISKDKGEKLC